MVLLFAWYIDLIFIDSWIEQICRIVNEKWNNTAICFIIFLFLLPFDIPPIRATIQPQLLHLDFINSVYYEWLKCP
jgi:hypothetical protein